MNETADGRSGRCGVSVPEKIEFEELPKKIEWIHSTRGTPAI